MSFLSRIEKPFMQIAGKLGQQPHLNAIRDGVVGALPLILIGSVFMLAAQPPLLSQRALDAYTAHPIFPKLITGYLMLIGLVALYVAFGVAHSLAKRYNQDPLSAALLSAAALLMANGVKLVPMLTATGVANTKFISYANLGAGGLFLALIIGLLVPEIQRLVKKYKLEIVMPAGVPPAVGRSFSALIPGLIVLGGIWAIVHVAGIDLFALVSQYLSGPVMRMSEVSKENPHLSLLVVFGIMLAVILIDSILWLLGVHAVAILAPMQAVWTAQILANSQMADPVFLHTRETLQFFIWIGGSGATITLPFLLMRARATSLRAIARVGVIPALFNINEPLIFGVPVMMNATLVIPFMLAPIVTLTTTVIAVGVLHWVPVPSLVVPWTLPGPIGAFLATHGAWQAAVLSLINIALAALIYWPFVRALDRKMAETEEARPAAAQPA